MDETDLRLCFLLSENSRTPYRKLADEVNLSVNAVHTRVQNMIDKNIIKKFYTKIGLRAFKGISVVSVEGKSEYDNIQELIDILGNNDNTFKIISASGNYLYVHGLIRDITKMNEYIESVKKEGQLKDPVIFMPDMKNFSYIEDFEFSKLDYEIIYSMRDDSRKSLSDVADEVGVSSKTVRRRLNRLKKNDAVKFGIELRPTQSSNFITFFELDLKPGYDRKKIMNDMLNEFYPYLNSVFLANNVPNKLAANVWGKTLDDIHSIEDELREEGYFESIYSRLYYDGKEFDTWRDEFLKGKVSE